MEYLEDNQLLRESHWKCRGRHRAGVAGRESGNRCGRPSWAGRRGSSCCRCRCCGACSASWPARGGPSPHPKTLQRRNCKWRTLCGCATDARCDRDTIWNQSTNQSNNWSFDSKMIGHPKSMNLNRIDLDPQDGGAIWRRPGTHIGQEFQNRPRKLLECQPRTTTKKSRVF